MLWTDLPPFAPLAQGCILQMKVKGHTGIYEHQQQSAECSDGCPSHSLPDVCVYETRQRTKVRHRFGQAPVGNFRSETRDLITLIISACWAKLPKLLVVIKLPSCFSNSLVVFDSVTSSVNEFHRLTIHTHKVLFTSIWTEFTAPYFSSSISLSSMYYGTRWPKMPFIILRVSIKDFSKIHHI